MAAAFEASEGEILPERLVRALEAGQAAGGDKRGKQSAAITTMKDQPYPYVDLRVDEHPDPIAELRRIYEVFKVQMLPFVEALPTRKNPEGDFGERDPGLPHTGRRPAPGGREGARRRLASASRPPDHTPRKLKKLRADLSCPSSCIYYAGRSWCSMLFV
jgi:hypothetical protein